MNRKAELIRIIALQKQVIKLSRNVKTTHRAHQIIRECREELLDEKAERPIDIHHQGISS